MRMVWLDSAQAPYREPLFCALAAQEDFRAAFILASEPERHLHYRPHPGYASTLLGSVPLRLPGPLARRLDSYQALLRPGVTAGLLADADVLVIPTWAEIASAWVMLRARRRGVPYVLYSESTLTSRRFRRGPVSWARRAVFRGAGAVIVPGPAAREAAVANGVDPARLVDSVNVVDPEVYGLRTRERRGPGAGPGPDAHRFVVIGQLIARKNVDTLLRAFARLSGAPTLTVAGDGAELAALRELAGDLGVAGRVRFTGFLDPDGVVEVLAQGQTLVLPSTEEVYGMTALEARVAGLQVVVSARAGIADNLAATPGAWIVEPDVDGLVGGLEDARRAWQGWDARPADAAVSPERAADDLLAAARIARSARSRGDSEPDVARRRHP